MAEKGKVKIKDPKKYAYAIEEGYGAIPSRPLFGNTFEDYKSTFEEKVKKARLIILAAWR